MPKAWEQGPCSCFNDCGGCLLVTCCTCFAYKEVADNIGDNNGVVYCLATFPCGCGCCVLSALGQSVAELQGIDSNMCTSCTKSFFDACCCYSCTVLTESRAYKASKQPGGQKMQRE